MSDEDFALEAQHVVAAAPRLFDLQPMIARSVSARQEGERRRAVARVTRMHSKHGHGPDGAVCGACAHLVRRFANAGGSYFKCELYGITRSSSSDWRKRWPACGQYQAPAIRLAEVEGGPAGSASSRSSRGSQGNRPVGER